MRELLWKINLVIYLEVLKYLVNIRYDLIHPTYANIFLL